MRPIKPKQNCLQLELGLSLYIFLKSFAIFWQPNRASQNPKECHKCTEYTKMFKVLLHNFRIDERVSKNTSVSEGDY